MPELPDVEAYIAALRVRVAGAALESVRLRATFLLRTVDPPIGAVFGRTVTDIRRVGKRIAFGFDNGLWLAIHLMIAGRLHWRAAGSKIAGRNDLAAFDFSTGTLTLTEAGSKRRASLHVLRDEAALRELDGGGIDVMSATLHEFRSALLLENRTLKRALTDPRVLSGIGNAYSDEILHAARLSPAARTGALDDEQWRRLYDATVQTLNTWVERLTKDAPKTFPEHVTAFRPEMAVHGRFGEPCPRCGTPVQRIRHTENETNYCPTCQTKGTLLADPAGRLTAAARAAAGEGTSRRL